MQTTKVGYGKFSKLTKHSSAEVKDPYARWFVAATSPMMYGGEYEMGDTYAREITQFGQLVDADPEWRDEYQGLSISEMSQETGSSVMRLAS